jgi:signal peptidase II
MLPLQASVNIVPGLLDLTHVRNTGAAFGLLNAADFPFKSTLILLIAAAALVAIALYAGRVSSDATLARIGLALILGGAIGNLIDRAVAGYVVDFVDLYWGEYHFWAFNVADSAITTGATLLVLDMLGVRWHVSKAL